MLFNKLKPPKLILDAGGIERLCEDRMTRGPLHWSSVGAETLVATSEASNLT